MLTQLLLDCKSLQVCIEAKLFLNCAIQQILVIFIAWLRCLRHWIYRKVEARCVKYDPWRAFIQSYPIPPLIFTHGNSTERKRSIPWIKYSTLEHLNMICEVWSTSSHAIIRSVLQCDNIAPENEYKKW